MSDKFDYWHYCVVGNIVKTRTDENGKVWNGVSAFSGGTKVYLEGRLWSEDNLEIKVIGRTRGKKFQVIRVPVNAIENVRPSKVYHHWVCDIMDDLEFYDRWWRNTEDDRKDVQAFADNWNKRVNS